MMKIPPEIRSAHERQRVLCSHLQGQVRDIVLSNKPEYWHFEDRLKELESFALKVETGRIKNLNALEDFFACTLVVRNSAEIPQAEELIRDQFSVAQRRPPDPNWTHKSPDAFPFDDIRFYASLKTTGTLPARDYDEIIFEIQIKTFLQHAWAIATHELVYKSDGVSWPRARIAYQIKAMLEHSELAIEEATKLASAPKINITDKKTRDLSSIIDAIRKRWPSERLPQDLKRVAENILLAFRCFGIGADRFAEIIDAESAAGRGANLLDMSPYAATLQGLFNHEVAGFKRFTSRKAFNRLYIPNSVAPPDGLDWPPASSHVTMY